MEPVILNRINGGCTYIFFDEEHDNNSTIHITIKNSNNSFVINPGHNSDFYFKKGKSVYTKTDRHSSEYQKIMKKGLDFLENKMHEYISILKQLI